MGRPGLGHGHLRLLCHQGHGQLQAGVSDLHRHLCPREAAQRLPQARLRVAGARRQAHAPLGEGGDGHQVGAVVLGRARGQCVGRDGGVPDLANGEVGVDEQGEQGSGGGADGSTRASARSRTSRASGASPLARWSAAMGAAASVSRSTSTSARCCSASSRRPWRTLSVGQAGQGSTSLCPGAQGPQPHRLRQGGVCLRPAAGRGEEPAVVGAAEGRHRREPAAFGDGVADADPLVSSGDVVRSFAGREQLAEDLLEHHEVVHLIAGQRGQGLVEEEHPLLGAIDVDEGGAEVGKRVELEIGGAEASGDRERLAELRLASSRIGLEHPLVEGHPPDGGGALGAVEQRLGPGQPSAHHGHVPEDHPVHVRQRLRRAARRHVVLGVAIARVGTLPSFNRRPNLLVQERRLGQAREHIPGGGMLQGALEGGARAGGVAAPERRPPLVHQIFDRRGHTPIISR